MSKEYIPPQVKADLWRKVSPKRWKSFLDSEHPEGQWEFKNEHVLKGRSPVKDGLDRTPSFEINFKEKFAYCFSTKTAITDPIRFVAEYINNEPYRKTVTSVFSNEFNVDFDGDYVQSLSLTHKLNVLKKRIVKACNQFLYESYQSSDDMYDVCDDAIAYLEDRASFDIVEDSSIGAMPHKEYLYKRVATDNWSKGYFQWYLKNTVPENVKNKGRYGGWLVFPYFLTKNTVGRIKLVKPEKGAKKHRYIKPPLEDNKLNDRKYKGFFGLDMFSGALQKSSQDEDRTVHVVEGEFDQISLASEQLNKSFPEFIVVAGGGGSVNKADYLSYSNFNQLSLVPDNDEGGKEFVMDLMEKTSHDEFDTIQVFDWPDKLVDEDPDDAVQRLGYEGAIKHFQTEDNYDYVLDWAERQILRDAEDVEDDNIRAKKDVVGRYESIVDSAGDFISNEFYSNVATALNLKQSTLKQQFASVDDDEGFKVTLVQRFHDFAKPIAVDKTNNVYLFNRKTRDIVKINMTNQAEVFNKFNTNFLNEEIWDWIKDEFGEPQWIKMTSGKTKHERTLKQKSDIAKDYFYMAFQSFVSKAPLLDHYEKVGQGVHFIDARRDETGLDRQKLDSDDPDQRIYIVNGDRVYKGVYRPEADKMQYEELSIPRDGKYIFELNRDKRWSSTITSTSRLNSNPEYDPEDVFDTLRDLIDVGWGFQEQQLQPTFLAAHLMTTTISMMFEHLMMVFFNAPSHSGKSTFINGLVANNSSSGDINVIEHSNAFDDYSSTGILQGAESESMMMCIDELENDPSNADSARAKQVTDFLEKTRNIADGYDGVKIVRGSASGEARIDHARFPMMAAAINPLQREEDFNRWNTIKLSKEPGRISPKEAILQNFGKDTIDDIREALTLVPLKYAHKIKEAYDELHVEVYEEEKIDYNQDRFMNRFLPALSIMKWLGKDYIEFGQVYTKHYDRMQDKLVVTDEERIFREIFHTPCINLPSENYSRNAWEILNSTSDKTQISEAGVGIFYTDATDYVCIDTDMVGEGILTNTSMYRQSPNSTQVHQKLKHHDLIRGTLRDIPDAKDRNKLRKHIAMRTGSSSDEILYLHIDDILEKDSVENKPTKGLGNFEEHESGDQL